MSKPKQPINGECCVCCRPFVSGRAERKTCGGKYCRKEHNRRMEKARKEKQRAENVANGIANYFSFVSNYYSVSVTDPFIADNISPDNGLPMSHIWNCIDNMAAQA
jgi:hypothetical protein